MEVLDQTVEVLGMNPTALRIQQNLKSRIGEYKIGTIPAAVDQVIVGSRSIQKS